MSLREAYAMLIHTLEQYYRTTGRDESLARTEADLRNVDALLSGLEEEMHAARTRTYQPAQPATRPVDRRVPGPATHDAAVRAEEVLN